MTSTRPFQERLTSAEIDRKVVRRKTKQPDDRDDRLAEFLELYTSHYPRLQMYVTALMPTAADDASDVLQETSLILWQKFEQYAAGTNFFAWACKIARIQVLKSYERRKRKGVCVLDSQVFEQLAVEAQAEYGFRGISVQMLEGCLAKLSEKDRSLIQSRYSPGITVHQLADRLGRSANSLSKSLGRIRRALLECLDHVVAIEVRE